MHHSSHSVGCVSQYARHSRDPLRGCAPSGPSWRIATIRSTEAAAIGRFERPCGLSSMLHRKCIGRLQAYATRHVGLCLARGLLINHFSLAAGSKAVRTGTLSVCVTHARIKGSTVSVRPISSMGVSLLKGIPVFGGFKGNYLGTPPLGGDPRREDTSTGFLPSCAASGFTSARVWYLSRLNTRRVGGESWGTLRPRPTAAWNLTGRHSGGTWLRKETVSQVAEVRPSCQPL